MMSILSLSTCAPQLTDAQLDYNLNDKTVMQRHLKCALGEGPCDGAGRRLRSK